MTRQEAAAGCIEMITGGMFSGKSEGRLQNDIYRWKLANREQVDALKREVERFTSHIKELPRDQSQLF